MAQRPVEEIHKWAERTTMEGLPNLVDTSASLCSRIFWLIVILSASCVGFYHLGALIRDYVDSDVFSEMKLEAAAAEFPDVTICSLKPASETVLWYYGSVVNHHLDFHWGYFEEWHAQIRRRRTDESEIDYLNRVTELFSTFMEILWISDDVKDLSLTSRTSIVECSFNGLPCDHRNFSLLQHYKHWNCYTFNAAANLKLSTYIGEFEAGLGVSIFTGNNIFESRFRMRTNFTSTAEARNYQAKGLSLKEYLTGQPGEFPLNSLLGENYESDGVLVILHPGNSYPLNQQSYGTFIVQNGMSATYRLETVVQRRLKRRNAQCRDSSKEPVMKYVTEFGNEPNDIRVRGFNRTARDIANERFQQEVLKRCGCHTHQFPFQTAKSRLCYYVPPHLRKAPSPEVLQRIACHNEWMSGARNDLSSGKYLLRSEQLCGSVYMEVQLDTSEWPNDEDLVPVVASYLRRWLNGTEFMSTRLENHVIDFSDDRVKSSIEFGRPMISREIVAIRSLANKVCTDQRNIDQAYIQAHPNECLDKQKVKKNFLRINVRLSSTTVVSYTEKYKKEIFELLSEIGNILGVWFGVSAITFFELVELLWIMVLSYAERRRRKREDRRRWGEFAASQQAQAESQPEESRHFDDPLGEMCWVTGSMETSPQEFDRGNSEQEGTMVAQTKDSAVAIVHIEPPPTE